MDTDVHSGTQVVFGNADQLVQEAAATLEPSAVFVLVDENTAEHCLPRITIDHTLISVPAGEQHKTLDTCRTIWERLTDAEADRQTIVVNLGGGVVCDMGGFAAATYKRGIRFIHVPTTLLAQVDAAVGGKTGVDLFKFKNMIGLFAEPETVVVDTAFLDTLDDRQMLNGWAEAMKHHLLAGQTIPSGNVRELATEELIRASIDFKDRVVSQDSKERGIRRILNYGHTIGHAMETLALRRGVDLLHGEAVAAGMIMETYLSQAAGLANAEDICKGIHSFFGTVDMELSAAKLYPIMANDKKGKDGQVMMVQLEAPGVPVWDVPLTEETLDSAIQYYHSL